MDELLEELGVGSPAAGSQAENALSAREKALLRVLDRDQAVSVDTLVMQLGLEASQLHVVLLQMEMAGYVVKDPSMGYRRSPKE